MLLINGKKYATSDSEMVDSLFNDGEGTLEKFHKIKHNKNESLFFLTEDYGVAICKGRDNGGMLIKFTMIKDCNGKESPFFQYRINKPEEEQQAFKWFIDEQQKKLEKH
jgi:hypothetical protein